MATTGEYTAAHGGVLFALVAVIVRVDAVNVILRREVNVRFELIANEVSIIYPDSPQHNEDPYTSGQLNTLIVENQGNLDAVIGSANYDLGHVVDVGSSGVATPGRCNFITKARGTSGGDSVELLAHEIGHQLGATHTFNNNNNGFCASFNGSNQRVVESAMEPGSGSTLMSYAGSCGPADLQWQLQPSARGSEV